VHCRRGDGQILIVDMHQKLEVPEHRRSAGTPLAVSLLTTSVRSTLFKAAANYGSNALHSRLRLEQSEHGGGVGHEPHSCSSRGFFAPLTDQLVSQRDSLRDVFPDRLLARLMAASSERNLSSPSLISITTLSPTLTPSAFLNSAGRTTRPPGAILT
jgi:hypothetical protein